MLGTLTELAWAKFDLQVVPCHGDIWHQVRIEIHSLTSPIVAKRSLIRTPTQVSREQISQVFNTSPGQS